MNDAIDVCASDLIALRRAGEGLALPRVRVRARQSGSYLSRFRGRGMEFEESRLYQPGDDIRNIDWRVTARTGEAHTKVYREERERPVLFCVDYRRAMCFATRGAFKRVVAARAACLLAWASHYHGDRVGGLVFSEHSHHELRPQRGKPAVLRLVRLLADAGRGQSPPAAGDTSLEPAIGRLRRVARPGGLVFVISDFRGLDARTESHLGQLARHNSVVLVFVFDPIEAQLPPAGVYRLRDGERRTQVDSANGDARARYAARFVAHRNQLEQLCRRHAMSLVSCATDVDLVNVVRSDALFRAAA